MKLSGNNHSCTQLQSEIMFFLCSGQHSGLKIKPEKYPNLTLWVIQMRTVYSCSSPHSKAYRIHSIDRVDRQKTNALSWKKIKKNIDKVSIGETVRYGCDELLNQQAWKINVVHHFIALFSGGSNMKRGSLVILAIFFQNQETLQSILLKTIVLKLLRQCNERGRGARIRRLYSPSLP